VEGAHLGAGCNDPPEDPIHVFQHLTCRNSEDDESVATEHLIPSRIATWLIAKAVPLPVDLDDQSTLQTSKIRSNPIGGELTPELVATRPFAQLLPEKHLWKSHLSA